MDLLETPFDVLCIKLETHALNVHQELPVQTAFALLTEAVPVQLYFQQLLNHHPRFQLVLRQQEDPLVLSSRNQSLSLDLPQ